MTPHRSFLSATFACILSGSVAIATAHAQEEGSTPGALPDPSTYQGSMEQQRQSDAQDQQFRQDQQQAGQQRQQNYDYAVQATRPQQRSSPSSQSYAPSRQREVQSSARPVHPSSDPATAAYQRGDYQETVRLIRPRAQSGDPDAQNKLGYNYYMGQGVPRDLVTAAIWYRKSADQGYADAQANLGRMYFEGIGVPRDPIEGYKWLILAGRQSAYARTYMQTAMRSITYDQMSEATRRAQLWTPVRVAAPSAAVTHARKRP